MKIELKRNRFFTTKVMDLIEREQQTNDYPHEFMNKMNKKEIKILIIEATNQVEENNIEKYKNIDLALKQRLREREELYQSLKKIAVEGRSPKHNIYLD